MSTTDFHVFHLLMLSMCYDRATLGKHVHFLGLIDELFMSWGLELLTAFARIVTARDTHYVHTNITTDVDQPNISKMDQERNKGNQKCAPPP